MIFRSATIAFTERVTGTGPCSAGTYTAADRGRDATADVDLTAQAQAEKTTRDVLDGIAAHCHPAGLHLLAADKSYTAGTPSRWGSPIAGLLAADISRETRLHRVAAWGYFG